MAIVDFSRWRQQRPPLIALCALLCLLGIACSTPQVQEPTKDLPLWSAHPGDIPVFVISDCAMGTGIHTDVEDGVALAWLVASDSANIIGAASTFGNVSEMAAWGGLNKVLDAGGYSGSRYRGPAHPSTNESATPPATLAALANAIRTVPDLHILSLGAFTLVADLTKAYPDLKPAWVGAMAGALRIPGNVPPEFTVEFNVYFDATAFVQTVGAYADVLHIVPLDATDTWLWDRRIVAERTTIHNRLSPFWDEIALWTDLSGLANLGDGMWLFDSGAAVALLDPPMSVQRETVAVCVAANGAMTEISSATAACPDLDIVFSAAATDIDSTIWTALITP